MAVNIDNTRGRARGSFALVGALSLLLAQLVFAGPAPAQVPGPVLFGADGAGGNPNTTLFTMNPANGTKTAAIGPIGFAVTGLAVDPTDGQLYGSTASQDPTGGAPGSLIKIDKETGEGTLLSQIISDCDQGTADITFTTDGQLWGWTECSDDLVKINKATGEGTVVGDSAFSSFGSGLSADPDDNTVWVTPNGGGPPGGEYFTVNKATGALTSQGTLNGDDDDSISALAWSCDGETLFGVSPTAFGAPQPRDFITINTATDSITILGTTGVDPELDAIAWDCPQPEPPTVMCKGQLATLVGTPGNDVLAGTSGKDVVAALGGNDRISTLGGNDVVCAGAGKDRVNGGGGKDRLLGQGGNDKLRGAAGKDNLRGGGGKDRCNGGPGVDTGNCEKEVSIP
ncbi:MAG: hypothetical protein ACRDIZ_09130 [Actinomycetota bacterium]